MATQKKRTKIFVDSSVQGSLAGRVSIHWICFFAIMIALQFLTTWMVNPMLTRGELFTTVVQNNGLFLIAIVLLLPSFIYDTVRLSNRFAGPMVRLKNAFEEVADTGELKEIQFRKGDFWMDIAKNYNAMIRSLKKNQASNFAIEIPSAQQVDPEHGVDASDAGSFGRDGKEGLKEVDFAQKDDSTNVGTATSPETC